ncbi:MAG: hypothetical protein PHG55_02375 [Verrucomicrobiota bacterium]|nr:hypothetical protein [Verrucomicrobiota bacterium]
MTSLLHDRYRGGVEDGERIVSGRFPAGAVDPAGNRAGVGGGEPWVIHAGPMRWGTGATLRSGLDTSVADP